MGTQSELSQSEFLPWEFGVRTKKSYNRWGGIAWLYFLPCEMGSRPSMRRGCVPVLKSLEIALNPYIEIPLVV